MLGLFFIIIIIIHVISWCDFLVILIYVFSPASEICLNNSLVLLVES